MNSKPARILRHRARKIVTMHAQWRIRPTVAVIALSIVTSVWSVAETAPAGTPAVFLQAVQEYQSAETQEKSGQTASAVSHYQNAAKLLEQLSKSNPDWQHDIVEYRLRKSREGLDRLGKPGEQAVTSNATANSTAGRDLTPKGGFTANLRELVGKEVPLKKDLNIMEGGKQVCPAGFIVKIIDVDTKNNRVLFATDSHDKEGIWKPATILGDEFSDGQVDIRIGSCRETARIPNVAEIPTGDEVEPDSSNPAAELELLDLINQHRMKKGLTPLSVQPSLRKAARLQCARALIYGNLRYSNGGVSKSWGGPIDMTSIERLNLYATNGYGYTIPGILGRDKTGRASISNLKYQTYKPSEIIESVIFRGPANDPLTKFIGIGNIHHQWWIDYGK